jgi:hypothetical protein
VVIRLERPAVGDVLLLTIIAGLVVRLLDRSPNGRRMWDNDGTAYRLRLPLRLLGLLLGLLRVLRGLLRLLRGCWGC